MKEILYIILVLILFIVCVFMVYNFLPIADWSKGDWELYFRPALRYLLEGQSPYSQPGFYNPPWLLLPLLPMAFFLPHWGSATLVVLNLFAYTLVVVRMRMNVMAIIIFVSFSGILSNSFNGNIEGLLAIGFLLPPQLGLFFVLAKPQFGIGMAVFWMVQAWIEGRTKQVVMVFMPVTLAFLVSFMVFGIWPAHIQTLDGVWWNASVFPYGVPVGLILLGAAIWKNDIRFALASSPFFAPYVAGHTWSVVWLGMLALVPKTIPFGAIRKRLTK